MNLTTTASTVAQRHALRLLLATQRELIVDQLNPESEIGDRCPRSTTMQLLALNPAVADKLLVELVTLVVKAGFFRSMTTSFFLTGIARLASAFTKKPAA